MFSLLRGGPKILILESSRIEQLKQYLIEEFNTEESNLDQALEKSDESYLLIFVVGKIKNVVSKQDIEAVFPIKYSADKVLCRLLSDHKCSLINSVRMGPRIILMRAFGDVDRVVEKIKKDYDGSITKFEHVIDKYNDEGTIIAFAQNSLNQNMNLTDMHDKSLFIKDDYYKLLKSLRMHGLKYVNEGLHNNDWHELEIKIYDVYGEYDLHYKRLLKIIESLELGVILGESWGKDYPRPLMSIEVYRLKFLTFYKPEHIKCMLLGLEHLDDGTRIVDHDIFYRRKKLYWIDIAKKKNNIKNPLNIRKLTRECFAKPYREEIFSKLGSEETEEILKLEEEILKSRTH